LNKSDLQKNNYSRRDIVIALAGLAAWPLVSRAIPEGTEPEQQRGDYNLPYESITVDRASITGLVDPSRAQFEERAKDFLGMVSKTAEDYVGRSRESHPDSIEQMLDVFNLSLRDKTGAYIPFCACGLAYVVARAYVTLWSKQPVNLSSLQGALAEIDHYHFFPSPSVWDMLEVAKAKGRWVANAPGVLPRPGWVAIYDFGKKADHVGLILSVSQSGIRSFECNTSGPNGSNERNGGAIAVKQRTYKPVNGYIRTDMHGVV
jgi:hypothetical protein